ncbi:MAG: hypothetical protein WEB00_14375 [Dehalococcoidia bacterium]
MTERRPGPFDDLMGGGSPRKPDKPREEPPREEPAATPPPPPPAAGEPRPSPFGEALGGERREPLPEPFPAWGADEPPRREPRPPAADAFSTAPFPASQRGDPRYMAAPTAPVRTARRSPSRGRSRDPLPYIIGGIVFVLALLVFALFLPPFELLGNENNNAPTSEIPNVCDGVEQSIRENIPAAPQNLVPVSPLRDLSANQLPCGPLDITLNLTNLEQDPAGLGFYTYDNNSYRRIADATLTTDGTAVTGQLAQLPENVLVMRSTGSSVRVEGLLPGGATLDEAAASVVDVVNPIAFSPNPLADGSLIGGVDAVSGDFEVIPVIRADAPEEMLAVETMLSDEALRTAHATAIVALVVDQALAGIELEYGCFGPTLGDAFTQFIIALDSAIGADKRLSVIVPAPDVCANFGPYALQDLGEVVDFIKLAPIRDQAIYREATIQQLRNALTAGVPRNKLILIISAYSTFRAPDGSVNVIKETEALALAATPTLVEGEPPLAAGTQAVFRGDRIDASSGASGIAWNDEALAVKFSYEENGTYEYFLENQFSIPFKLDLVARFQIAGVAVDDASSTEGLADVWTPIASYVQGGAPTLLKPAPEAFVLEWRVDGTVVPNETGPSFRWTAVDQPGGVCTFGPTTAAQRCVTLVVSDGDIRVGSELTVDVAAADPGGGDETPTATPTETPSN